MNILSFFRRPGLSNPKRKACFECGNPAHHEHHVVPKALGGTATVPLCIDCHERAHGKGSPFPKGRQSPHSEAAAKALFRLTNSEGFTIRRAADILSIPESTARDILSRLHSL
jgi:5-methylcytosine-specific restriction endonuclease McrA